MTLLHNLYKTWTNMNNTGNTPEVKKSFVFNIDDSHSSKEIEEYLDNYFVEAGILNIFKFSDGEISTQFETTIRDSRVFIIGSTDTQENFFKMALAIDAAKRASAYEINAVIPYFGYSRQDRRDGTRGPIGAKLMADMLSAAGLNRLIVLDLHADQIQGFFNIPVDHIPGYHIFDDILIHENACICSPDAGGVKRADKFYKRVLTKGFDASFAMLSKRRDKPNSIESMELIGDVAGKNVYIIDDMVDTAGTLCKAASVLKEKGAKSVMAIITHAVLSGDAINRIEKSDLQYLYVSDSISHNLENTTKIVAYKSTRLIAEVINCITLGESLEHSLLKDL